jgi:hypothetical protein
MAAVTAPRTVRVTIDRLVLHGVDRADAAAVQRALVAELGAAMAGTEPGAGASRDHIRLDVAPAADPGALGHNVGRTLAAALAGRGPPR